MLSRSIVRIFARNSGAGAIVTTSIGFLILELTIYTIPVFASLLSSPAGLGNGLKYLAIFAGQLVSGVSWKLSCYLNLYFLLFLSEGGVGPRHRACMPTYQMNRI